eukprot:scaffold310993_cov32-Tisochrysis_lutea.AAC.2
MEKPLEPRGLPCAGEARGEVVLDPIAPRGGGRSVPRDPDAPNGGIDTAPRAPPSPPRSVPPTPLE